ncbi:zinc ribbon domain-containing protein [Bacillus sp. OTU530]|uniref:zinc ribbon domain-containing protein n=1 Tax=Bacillus sp. OTU530 TaxID=3043862 RepID=UPI00406CB71B
MWVAKNIIAIDKGYNKLLATSQVCHLCDEFGTRKNEVFICKKCGQMDADSNASRNILERYTDTDITKYLSYKKVKTILLNRLKTKKKYPQIIRQFTSTL